MDVVGGHQDLTEVAAELGIDMNTDAAAADPVDTLRSAFKRVTGELATYRAAHEALSALAKTQGERFAPQVAEIAELITVASREHAELRRDYVERVLMPLAEIALPSTKYPFLFAQSRSGGGDVASASSDLKKCNEWADSNPSRVDPSSLYDINIPWRREEEAVVSTIFEQSCSTLIRMESWLQKRVNDRAIADRLKTEKAARQRALKAVNKARRAAGQAELPDPDTKAGAGAINKLGNVAHHHRYQSTSRDYARGHTAAEVAEQAAIADAEDIKRNIAVFGNAECEIPHPLYLTRHQLDQRVRDLKAGKAV